MRLVKYVATALLVSAALAGNAAAQQDMLEGLVGRPSSFEVTSDTGDLVVLRAIPEQRDGVAPAAIVISCWRGAPANRDDILGVQDPAAHIDERVGVEAGFCDALVDAVARRKGARGR